MKDMDCYGDYQIRTVKWHVKNYWDIKREVRDARDEMRKRSGTPERRSMGFVSDPTQSEAIKNLTPLKYVCVNQRTVKKPEEWTETVEKVMNNLDASDRKIVEVGFWKARSWQSAVLELNMDKNTYYRRRSRVLTLFAIEASSRGLIAI